MNSDSSGNNQWVARCRFAAEFSGPAATSTSGCVASARLCPPIGLRARRRLRDAEPGRGTSRLARPGLKPYLRLARLHGGERRAGGTEICNAFVRFSRGGAGSLAGCRAGARRVVRRCRRHVLGGAAPGDRGDRPRLSDQEPGRDDRGPRSREGETQQRCAGSAGDDAGRASAGDLRGPERPGRGQSEGRCHAGRVLRLSLPVLQAGRPGDRRAARRGQEAARRLQGISGARPRVRPPPRGPRWRRRSRENTRRCTAR